MRKGPYSARYGDFYTAGALELRDHRRASPARPMWISAEQRRSATARRLAQYDRRLVGMASPERAPPRGSRR